MIPIEAIILAGGLGTRLKSSIADLPKSMAPVAGKPFLEYVLRFLSGQGVLRVILAVGYKKEFIIGYFGGTHDGMTISYSAEETPLQTGGAVKKALELCCDDSVILLNGDTFFNVDLRAMHRQHIHNAVDVTVAVKEMKNFDRYGCVVFDDKAIYKFLEKKPTQFGYINGGCYIINRRITDGIQKTAFSFEKEILEWKIGYLQMQAFISDGYFIDIGVPNDYEKAQIELASVFS